MKIGIRILIAGALCACVLIFALRASSAQFPIPISIPSGSAAPHGQGVKQVRGLDTAQVTFEGIKLFTIAAAPPTSSDAVPPIVRRLDAVEDNLVRIVPTPGGFLQPPEFRFDPETFRVEIGKDNGYPTL